jgi:NAD(P)-dependent dehydrogenase (short-subunit alcohol dehydrogenase family)
MMLKAKNAVIYGAAGGIGSAVARAFAREGAKLFLSGRTLPAVKALASEIVAGGGIAEAAQVDALDEQAVERYVGSVVEKAGAIDISFAAISVAKDLPDKMPFSELSAQQFSLPIAAYTQSNFFTARSAARRNERQTLGRDPDHHRRSGASRISERRRQWAGLCGGRGAESKSFRGTRAARHPRRLPHAACDPGDGYHS